VTYQIERSVRCRAANSAYLGYTPASSGNRRKWTVSFWVKRGILGVGQYLLSTGSGAADRVELSFNSNDTMSFLTRHDADSEINTSTAVFRDPSVWMHVVVQFDCSNATAADRIKIYVNNVQVISGSGATIPDVDHYWLASGTPMAIGRENFGVTGYSDCLIARFYSISGQLLAPSVFAAEDPTTGTWSPVAPSISYGASDIYLDFSDNSGATSSTLGKDRSGNNNDWTPNNISVTAGATNDSLVDTPTNYGTDTGAGGEVRGSYCTWNPIWPGASAPANGNLDSPSAGVARGTHALLDYDAYWEITSTGGISTAGVVSKDGTTNTTTVANGKTYGFRLTASGTLDYKNITDGGSWTNITSGLTGVQYPYTSGAASTVATLNAGQRPFAATAPSGFKAICTQNLPEPTNKKVTNDFVAVLDTETNIAATLAAARSGWSSYVDILRNRSNIETWAWRFSHDSGNEYATSTTATRQAARTLSGSDNWVGYSIKVGGSANVKAGSASHTNGADTTVTHNAGVARALILLFPRAGGAVSMYHPDLTSGKLVYLTGTDNETTDAAIKNVSANSFDIDTGEATDTYDYLVIPESDIFSLGNYTGNAGADGPFVWADGNPYLLLGKQTSGATPNYMYGWDRVTSPTNLPTSAYRWGSDAVPSSSTGIQHDLLSNGFKPRGTDTGINGSAYTYVFAAFKVPFKYSAAEAPVELGVLDFSSMQLFVLP
jgi:hypothetical protein